MEYTLWGMHMSHAVFTPSQLGQVLKGHRKAAKLTQKSVGESVGLLPKTISKLELASESATIGSLFKLLSALELELAVQRRPDAPASKEW